MFDAIAKHTFQFICCYVLATIAATFGAILIAPLAVIALPLVLAVCGIIMLVVVPWAYPIVLGLRRYAPQRYKLVPLSMLVGALIGTPIVSIGLKAYKGYYSPSAILSAITNGLLSPMIIPAAAVAGVLAWFLSREDAY